MYTFDDKMIGLQSKNVFKHNKSDLKEHNVTLNYYYDGVYVYSYGSATN